MVRNPRCQGIVPPYLLQQMALHADAALAGRARASLLLDGDHRQRRAGVLPSARPRAATHARDDGTAPLRTISDAHSTTTLPGDVVRAEGAAPTGDAATDEAYDGLGATWALFHDAYGRDSLDGAGLALDATVHYGRDYDNAFWDGARMVFGDGDGTVFERFTIAVDVIGHELTHGVTEKAAGLVYQGQSGALNESVSDVFGSLVKQRVLGQDAASADWLIGAGLFRPGVKGVALRSMRSPGTAYDDPVLGRDPQPATMADYVQTRDDNGGVHVNSGIPNRAFYLAATGIGGDAARGAGQVWYDVLTGGLLPPDADFATFAALTVRAAEARFGAATVQAQAVADAWAGVGVEGSASSGAPSGGSSRGSSGGSSGGAPSGVVGVSRSGGLLGRSVQREVDVDEMPADRAQEWRSLLASGVLQSLTEPEPAPDRYVYRVWCVAVDLDVTAGEQQLPDHVRATLEATLAQRSTGPDDPW